MWQAQRRALEWSFFGPSPPERTEKKFQEKHKLNAGRQLSPILTKLEHSPLIPPFLMNQRSQSWVLKAPFLQFLRPRRADIVFLISLAGLYLFFREQNS